MSVACSASGSLGHFVAFAMASSGSTIQTSGNALGSATTTMAQVANTTTILTGKAIVTTVGATGNITMQIRKLGDGQVTIYKGSIMKVRKLA